jgi:hypothetical protein
MCQRCTLGLFISSSSRPGSFLAPFRETILLLLLLLLSNLQRLSGAALGAYLGYEAQAVELGSSAGTSTAATALQASCSLTGLIHPADMSCQQCIIRAFWVCRSTGQAVRQARQVCLLEIGLSPTPALPLSPLADSVVCHRCLHMRDMLTWITLAAVGLQDAVTNASSGPDYTQQMWTSSDRYTSHGRYRNRWVRATEVSGLAAGRGRGL